MTYTWADDNSSCTATATCSRDASHTRSYEATVTETALIEADCENDGNIDFYTCDICGLIYTSDEDIYAPAEDAIRLLAIYDALEAQGIRCCFYLTETPPAEQVARPGIEYAAKPLTYRQMLERNLRARCILEMNQQHAVGYTSRFLEAVMYDRKLLTDNPGVADSPFYDPRWIRIYRGPADIDPAFIRDPAAPDFRYAGEFSPRGLIDFIDRELLTA